MSDRRRVSLLMAIMMMATLIVSAVSITLLYQTALSEEKARLVETAQSQARLIESIARFDTLYNQDYPEGAEAATLSQIRDSHNNYTGFGQTGEFTLARLEDNSIVFLLRHRHTNTELPKPVPYESDLAEPMRQALSGQSGTIIGLDYRGKTVLAAYEPVAELDMGIVAKIDLVEIRNPFFRTGIIVGAATLIVTFLGMLLFLRITEPLLQNIKTSEERFKAITANTPDHISIQNNALKYTMVINPQLGLREDDILGKTDHDFLSRKEADILVETKKQVIESGEPTHFKTSLISQTGKAEFFVGTYMPIFDKQRQENGLIGYFRNVTESKETEEKIRYQANLLNTVGQAVIATDLSGKIIYWNRFAESLYGWPADDAIGKNIIDVTLSQTSNEQAAEIMENLGAGKTWSGDFLIQRRDGTTFPAFVTNTPIVDDQGVLTGIIGVSSDITERKEREEQLHRSEVRFKALFEQAGDYCMILDPHTKDGIPLILDANEAAYKSHGYTREEYIGRPVADIDDEEGKRLVVERTQKIMSGQPFYVENIHVRRDGTTFPVSVRANRIDIEGEPSLIFSTEYDISEQVQARGALVESEEKFRLLHDNAGLGIGYISPEGVVISFNSIASKDMGGVSKDFEGKSIFDLFPKEFADSYFNRIQKAVNADQRATYEDFVQLPPQGKWFLSTYSRIVNLKNEILGVQIISQDITIQKEAEEELEKHRNHLEELVKQRTEELQDKMEEKNTLFDLMIGREVRMAELKNVIKSLRKQLKENELVPNANDPLLGDEEE